MSHQKFNEDAELTQIQKEAFNYFANEINLSNGLIKDKTAENWPASIAAVGFALASYPVAVERGFISRAKAVERTLTTLRFFWNSKQGPEPDATGYNGFYYHFLDIQSGKRIWNCEISTIDTTFLIAGMLTAAHFFDHKNPEEEEIRHLAESLYQRVNWSWAQNSEYQITMGWKPEEGFLKYNWEGYDEALLLFILGLGSPTHPLDARSYDVWTNKYSWKKIFDIEYLYGGSLFIHQFSHIWIDFRNIKDKYMRDKNSDYFENSKRATYVQHQYAISNPLRYIGYNEKCWGISASDGPGPIHKKIEGIQRCFYDYIARSAPFGPDDGTLAPWAAIASLPFAPEIILPLIDHYTHHLQLKCKHLYGFSATFNQTFKNDSQLGFWISPWHFGINQGPIILMTENYRTGLIWQLMRNCSYIKKGLKLAGFV